MPEPILDPQSERQNQSSSAQSARDLDNGARDTQNQLRGLNYEDGSGAVRPPFTIPVRPDGAREELTLDVGGKATRLAVAQGILKRQGIPQNLIATSRQIGLIAVQNGILQPASDLRLGEPISRAEAATMVSRAFGVPQLGAGEIKRVFKDLASFHWSAPFVYGAVSVGVLSGYEDETFRPMDNLESQWVDGLLDRGQNPPGQPSRFDPRQEIGAGPIMGGASVHSAPNAHTVDKEDHPTRDPNADKQSRVDSANAIVDSLGAGTNSRYKRRGDNTYCNVYAHDYAFLMGAFIPRLWWYDPAAAFAHEKEHGVPPEPKYGKNCYEMTATAIENWFHEWGHMYGWSRVGDTDPQGLTQGQTLANDGRVVVISGDRQGKGPGHITAVVPETENWTANRNGDDQVTLPVQSESGWVPRTRGKSDWINDGLAKYSGGLGVWAHG